MNRHGDSWEVRVSNYQNTDKFWFEKGWRTFTEQNKLPYDHHIVFKYDGKSTFEFLLFDEKNDDKEYVRIPNLKPQSQSKESQPQPEPELTERQDMKPDQEENTRSRRRMRRKSAPRISEEEKEAIFQSGFPSRNNPYFETKRSHEREQLYIPNEVVKDFNLRFPEPIGICDEKGCDWEAKVGKWTDGRICFSKGWKSLCRWNNVKRGDWCVIEIVRPETPGAEIFLKTHLVPAASLMAARRS